MSSLNPVRRATRSNRTATHKDNENATARQLRNGNPIRAKPVSSSSHSIRPSAGPVRAPAKVTTAPSLKQQDVLSAKRKRDTLGEINTRALQNKPKGDPNATKGKEASLKPASQESVTTRHVPTRVVGNNGLRQMREEEVVVVVAEDDRPVQQSLLRSLSKRPHGRIVNGAEEEQPVLKKRRTSSEPLERDLDAFVDHDQAILEEEAEIAAGLNADIETYADEVAAEPIGPLWTDLDIDDGDDPTMVSEYVHEIFDYLKKLELTTMPNPDYMDTQKELGWKMRGILADWLINTHAKFRLLPETLFLAINIVDRFLSNRVVSLAKLQLVGIAALLIAAKNEEIIVPSIMYFVAVAESTCTLEQLKKAESYVLQTINWNLSYPSPVHFLRRISKADDYNVPVRTLAKYLLEISVVEWRLVAAPPSLLAAAAMWLARLVLGYEHWTPNLVHYSSYSESDLIGTASIMISYILKPIEHESFYKKYQGRRYSKASMIMALWTRERWEEGTKIDLNHYLPRIKARIRLERTELEAEEAALARKARTEREEKLRTRAR